ncbi:MAG: hypothetical protein MR294_05845 [Bacteroidales bacterium]|nr:hypothetical protein [Bacteroidales bacterium]
MVSVTGSVTWISYGSSVIGDTEMARFSVATGREEPREAERWLAQRRMKMPLPFQGAGQGKDPRFTDRCGKKTVNVSNRSDSGRDARRGARSPAGFLHSGLFLC